MTEPVEPKRSDARRNRDAILAAALEGLTDSPDASLNAIAKDLPTAGNLWADTSQADGVEAVRGLMRTPLRDRLVFGSHAPLFIAEAAFLRVVVDLDDATAQRILHENAAGLTAPLIR